MQRHERIASEFENAIKANLGEEIRNPQSLPVILRDRAAFVNA